MLLLWCFGSFDVESGENKVMVGVEREGSVGTDIVDHGEPGSGAYDMV